jgi:hypothetical protein
MILSDALLPDPWSLFLADIGFGDSCVLDVLSGQETTTFAMIQAQGAERSPRQRGMLIASWDDLTTPRGRAARGVWSAHS